MIFGNNVVLDRSAFSTLAISYANEKKGNYRTFEQAIEQYKKMCNSFNLLVPDYYVFLYTNNEERMSRNHLRTKKLSEKWLDEDFINYQEEFYKIVSLIVKNKVEIYTTNKSKDYVSKRIMELSKK